jgi:hypothetical protein
LVEVISIRLRFGHAVDIPVAATVDSRDVEIHNAAIEMAAKLADTEIELPGDMPREIEEKLRGVPLEISLRATVRSTKSSISSRIRALKRTAPKTDGGRDGK